MIFYYGFYPQSTLDDTRDLAFYLDDTIDCAWDIFCDLLEIICDFFAKSQREFGPNSTGTLGTMYKYTFLTKNIFWKNFGDIFMKKISLAIFRMIKYQSCRYKNHTKKYNYLTRKYNYHLQNIVISIYLTRRPSSNHCCCRNIRHDLASDMFSWLNITAG